MTEESGRRAAAEYAAGRLLLDKYRGRACYAHPAQAAEFFTRAETGLKGLDDLRFQSSERTSERSWRVRFAGPANVYETEVSRHLSDFHNQLTCHSGEPTPVPQFALDHFRAQAR
jgi:hypothetical protein